MRKLDMGMVRPCGRTVGSLLSGVALLMIAGTIARIGFVGLVTSQAWEEASQAAWLVFLLKFGESRRTTATEVNVGIILGATVGAVGALLESWTATAFTIVVAMILIHHPCPKSKNATEVEPASSPSIGFWQLLLATFLLVYRSAAGSGLQSCCCSAFTHTLLLVAAVELGDVLSAPAEKAEGQGLPHAGDVNAAETPRSARPSAAISPSGWSTTRHGASGSMGRNGTQSPNAGLAVLSAAPGLRKRTSLMPFLEAADHEVAHLLPPIAPGAKDGYHGGDRRVPTRASCPSIPQSGGQNMLTRSASASVDAVGIGKDKGVGDINGSGGSGRAAPWSLNAISTSPLRWSTGRSRVAEMETAVETAVLGAQCSDLSVRTRFDTPGWEEPLPDGNSPDGHSQSRNLQEQQRPLRECGLRNNSRSPTTHYKDTSAVAAAVAVAAVEVEMGPEAIGLVERNGGGLEAHVAVSSNPLRHSGNAERMEGVETSSDISRGVAGRELATPSDDDLDTNVWQQQEGRQQQQVEPLVVSEAEFVGQRVILDPRVASGDGQQHIRYRRETGASTYDYILLESTFPGHDGAVPYASSFSSDDNDDDEEDMDDDVDTDDEGNAGDDDNDHGEYNSELCLDDDGEGEGVDIDESASDGCFSLVVDDNGAPLGDCVVGVNRLAWRTHGSQPRNVIAPTLISGREDEAAENGPAVNELLQANGVSDTAVGPGGGLPEPEQGGDPTPVKAHISIRGLGVPYLKSPPRYSGKDLAGSSAEFPSCTPDAAAAPEGMTRGGGDVHRKNRKQRAVAAAAALPELARWHQPRRVPAAPHLLPDAYRCDIADLADLEDLMSLEEAEAGAAGRQAVSTATTAVAASGLQLDAAPSASLAAVDGSEAPYPLPSHSKVHGPSSSVVASKPRWAGAPTRQPPQLESQQKHLARQLEQQAKRNLALQEFIQRSGRHQHLPGYVDGDGGKDTVAEALANGGPRGQMAIETSPPEALPEPPSPAENQELPQHAGYDTAGELSCSCMPLEERTLAQHIADMKMLDPHGKQYIQLQQLRSQLQQQQGQGQAVYQAATDAAGAGSCAVLTPVSGETMFAASNASLGLMLRYLREVEGLMASASDICGQDGLTTGLHYDGEDRNGGGGGDGARADRGGVDARACGGDVDEGSLLPAHCNRRRRHNHHQPLSRYPPQQGCAPPSRDHHTLHHDATSPQILEGMETHFNNTMAVQSYEQSRRRHKHGAEAASGRGHAGGGARRKRDRTRGRGRHVRKLSEGQLHARQVYGIDDGYGYEYGHVYGYADEYGYAHEDVHMLGYSVYPSSHHPNGVSHNARMIADRDLILLQQQLDKQHLEQQQAMQLDEGRSSLTRSIPADAGDSFVYGCGATTIGGPANSVRLPQKHQRQLRSMSPNTAVASPPLWLVASSGGAGSAQLVVPVESDLPSVDDLRAYELRAVDLELLQQRHAHHSEHNKMGWPGSGKATTFLPALQASCIGMPCRPMTADPPSSSVAWGGAFAASASVPGVKGVISSTEWQRAAIRNGSSWGGGEAAAAAVSTSTRRPTAVVIDSPPNLRCPSLPIAAVVPSTASAPPTPPHDTVVVEPFFAAGQAVYRSFSGTRRYEDRLDRRRGVSDNHKVALAAASRSRPTTPQPPGSPLPVAAAAVAGSAGAVAAAVAGSAQQQETVSDFAAVVVTTATQPQSHAADTAEVGTSSEVQRASGTLAVPVLVNPLSSALATGDVQAVTRGS